jgi:ATP-dependent Clp endopeptidase proteolytic subunit ClpP
MKWKHKGKPKMNEEEETELQIPPIFITTGNEGLQYTGGNIRILENRLFFYGDISEASALDLNRSLYEIDLKLQNTRNTLGENSFKPTIHLHINTFGGSIYAAFSTVDTIRSLKSDVYTYIDGSVASAGTLITASGKKRYIGKHGHMLIHQLSSGVYGKFSEMEDEIFNCTNLMKILKDFYKKNTKIPMKKLDELLKRDIWMPADECLEHGIVDEIL